MDILAARITHSTSPDATDGLTKADGQRSSFNLRADCGCCLAGRRSDQYCGGSRAKVVKQGKGNREQGTDADLCDIREMRGWELLWYARCLNRMGRGKQHRGSG